MPDEEQQTQQRNSEKSTAFVLSVYLLIAGIVLLTLLVGLIPTNMPEIYEGMEDPERIYSNWFYRVEYNPFAPPLYEVHGIKPGLGFYLLLPVVMILLSLSGGTFLISDFQETKRLIYLSWGSYLLPIIVGAIKTIQLIPIDFWAFEHHGINFSIPLGLYPLYTQFFLQLSLLLNKQSFKGWVSFSVKKDEPLHSRIGHYYHLLSTIIFSITYFCTWVGSPIALMIYVHGDAFAVIYITTTSTVACYLGGFIVGEIIPKVISLVKKLLLIIIEPKNATDS
ncbi:MAG: hypothetical protein GF308_04115 [Candidatus Heimdallarchaeota archaeon]|nr:hypothetical protein [Candidatus Heimdallarchaeota archaeon]